MSLFGEMNGIMQSAMKPGASANRCIGVSVAKVVSLADPENKGRVQIKLLMTDKGSDGASGAGAASGDEAVGDLGWAYVATPMAGEGCGVFVMPAKDDMVLVAFEGGDVHKPFVLGSVWGGRQTAPIKIEEGKSETILVQTKQNNKITVCDKEDGRGISVETPKGNHIKLDDKNDKLTFGDKEEKNSISIDTKNGAVTMKCSGAFKIQAGSASLVIDGSTGNIKINAGQNIEIKGIQMNLEAQSTASIKATAQLSAESQGLTSVKGLTLKLN